MVDDVDAELDALEDHRLVGHVGADLGAALVGGVDDCGDLVAGHVAGGPVRVTVTGTGEDLDGLDTAADLLADQRAQLVGTVGAEVECPASGTPSTTRHRLFMSPVVPMWCPHARMRGPGMMSSAMAILSCASMSCAHEAPE